MKNILSKSAIAAGVVLSLATVARPAQASSFNVTVEAAGIQNSTANLVTSYVDTFGDSTLTPGTSGYQAKGLQSNLNFGNDANGNSVGTFNQALIEDADQYGGAGGTGNYFDVDTTRSGNSNYSSSTLTFKNPERYFGLWWSAGDANNVLTFYSGNNVVDTLTTASVLSFIQNQPNSQGYMGNPNSGNPNSPSSRQDSNEPFAFLNFFANTGVTFDKIVFSNVGQTGFEADNFTVARDYTTTTGKSTSVPESSSVLGLFAFGFVGAGLVMSGRLKKKSVLELS